MTIRDRGKIKWLAASFMPEAFAMTREMYRDAERQAKPLLDVYQAEEFDSRLAYAMESNLAVKISVLEDGFTADYTGRIHYVDPITHQLRIEVNTGEYERITFDDVVGVVVVD